MDILIARLNIHSQKIILRIVVNPGMKPLYPKDSFFLGSCCSFLLSSNNYPFYIALTYVSYQIPSLFFIFFITPLSWFQTGRSSDNIDLNRITYSLNEFGKDSDSALLDTTLKYASRFKPPKSLCSLTTQKDKLLIKLKIKLPKLLIPHHMVKSQLTGSSFLQHTGLISLSRLMQLWGGHFQIFQHFQQQGYLLSCFHPTFFT